ncbi:MAG TPA: hypothetical protein VFM38_04480 [Candidatus Limnocylindrales bacterium]|nr:hypothetical protein [Candidatus Limnocylindrales bacterium]
MRPLTRQRFAPDAAPQVLREDVRRSGDGLAERRLLSRLRETALSVQGLRQEARDRRDVVALSHRIKGGVVLAEFGFRRQRIAGQELHRPRIDRDQRRVEAEPELLEDEPPASVVVPRSVEIADHGSKMRQGSERDTLGTPISFRQPQQLFAAGDAIGRRHRTR